MDTTAPTQELIGRLASLGDENRLRLLTLLERGEFTVSELTSVLQLPQSTVSRHLKVLASDGWIRSRQEGTSRHYRMALPDAEAEALWRVSRRMVEGAPWLAEDAERAEGVLAERRRRAQEFFSGAAAEWDELRTELYGGRVLESAAWGLLEPGWTVGDLGCGTGALTEKVAPFVSRVIAVDRSREMLDAARARLEGLDPASRAESRQNGTRGCGTNVELREGELESLPIEGKTLDAAVMMLVLHYVPEPRRALEEARRVLEPGGRLVIVDMREHGREEYRATMGHLWPGFAREELCAWIGDAGLAEFRYVELPPDPEASGPLLFAARAVRPIED